LSTIALSIYLPFDLAKRVSEAAKASGQARSAWVVGEIERLLDGKEDAMTSLATNQICRVLAVVEDAIELLPDHERRVVKARIQHRAEQYRQAAFRRLGQ
jgi:predicted DNA-binding protein